MKAASAVEVGAAAVVTVVPELSAWTLPSKATVLMVRREMNFMLTIDR